MSITHSKVSAVADCSDTSLVLPSDWNDDHVISNLVDGSVTPKTDVEIQAAIDALTAGRTWKETVKLVGSFTIGATVTIPSYTILDMSEAVVALGSGINDNMFENSDSSGGNTDIEIWGGVIDGNQVNQTNTSTIIQLVNVTRATAHNIFLKNSYTHCLELKMCYDFIVGDIQCYNAGVMGVRIAESIRGVVGDIQGNTTGTVASGQVLEITRGSQDISFGNISGYNTTGGVVEIFGGLRESDGLAATTKNISGGIITSNTSTERALQIASGTDAVGWGTTENVSIAAVSGRNNYNTVSIAVLNAAGTIRDIIIGKISSFEPTHEGVYISQGDGLIERVDIGEIIVRNPGSGGVYLSGNSSRDLSFLNVDRINVYSCAQYGVSLRYVSKSVLSQMIVDTCDYGGVRLHECDNVRVAGGCITNNAQAPDGNDDDGITVRNSTHCEITGLRIHDSQTPKTQVVGILEVGTSDHNNIHNNDLTDGGATPLTIAGATTGRISKESKTVYLQDVQGTSSTNVHAAAAGNGALQTITADITNPSHARNIRATTSNVAAPSGASTITGTDQFGRTISEDVTLVAGGDVDTNNAFATVTSFTIPAGVSAADTVSLGTAKKLGLLNPILATADAVYCEQNGTAYVPTYNATYHTAEIATVSANDDFLFVYNTPKNRILTP